MFQILDIGTIGYQFLQSIIEVTEYSESGMFVLLSAAAILAGFVLAWAADRNAVHWEMLETCAGISLFAGFGLLGALLSRLAA